MIFFIFSVTRNGALLLERYGYSAEVLPHVRIQRNFDLDTLLVTRSRKVQRRNTAPNIGQISPRSILKRNDLPFAIRGRRKSVSFGTIERRRFCDDSPESSSTNNAPSIVNDNAIAGPSNQLVQQVSDITLNSPAQPEVSSERSKKMK